MLVDQTVNDPLRGVLLLRRRVQVCLQEAVDDPLVRVQPGRPGTVFLAWLGSLAANAGVGATARIQQASGRAKPPA
ncbi:hypothetical protein ABZ958_34160 [Streptomyces sp. NPDC046237]|uniref:hypothetical protein n=1 Tax=Streptomyces sp. NPDC046237 TaxID=3154914 RepID=UPI0033D28E53